MREIWNEPTTMHASPANDGDVRVVLEGRGTLGAGVALALSAAIDAAPESQWVVVEMEDVDEVDSRAMGALQRAAHRLAEDARLLVLRGARPAVNATLRAAGLHRTALVMPVQSACPAA